MVLEGASALVTGAGRGIGRAIAVGLANAGARLALVARTAGDLESLAEEIRRGGGRAVALPADLRRAEECRRVVEAAARAHGGLRILVNNAGVGAAHPVAETSDEEWETVFGTNVGAVFHLTRAALPLLRERGGHVFMISSLAGRNAIAGMAAYCASKAALDHFAACLMLEVRQQGIKVTTIAPGSVDTAFGAGFRAGGKDASWKLTPDDVAACVLDLLRARDEAHLSRVEMRPLRPPSGA